MEVPVVKETAKEPAKMETDESSVNAAPSTTAESDVNMQDAKGAAAASGAENGVPESGDEPVQMESDAKVTSRFHVF